MRRTTLIILSVLAAGFSGRWPVEAATLFVASNGSNSLTCGSATFPCRSISQAIHNAGRGDKIVVGPGVYGDVDQDNSYSGPGDEPAQIGTNCNCLVYIDKNLQIISRDGATATILDANGTNVDIVSIAASGATFGTLKHGFTLLNAAGNGLTITSTASRVIVGGNRALMNMNGFVVDAGSISNVIQSNLAVDNLANGYVAGGEGTRFVGNAAVGNGLNGFIVNGKGNVIRDSVVTGNGQDGVDVETGAGHRINHNALIANTRFGIYFDTNCMASATANNIFGNNARTNAMLNGQTIFNCGIGSSALLAVTATSNYFGSASGPGADPADNVCNFGSAPPLTNGALTSESNIKPITP